MKGQILDFTVQSNSGTISAADGKRYSFAGSEWKGAGVPMRGMTVDFEADKTQAKAVYLALGSASPASKNKVAAGLLAILLGGWGIHKFYLGFTGPGLVFLLTNTIGFAITWLMLFIPNLALGVIALIAGVAYLIGALSGSRDVLQPLSGLRLGAAEPAAATPFRRVANSVELDARIQAAAGRPVMLDFYADWCVSCKEMERFTFSDERVQARLREMELLQADVTANNAEHAALLKRFNLFGPPGIIFFDRNGREIQGLRVIGFQPADKFAAVLDQVLGFR